ncbi:MAG: bifunctional [glutamine synthetase] adenylyltransferase/[glutamine synthetase]-adenylyl-L-tyrosine phosphorylase [Alphaproteobacteria bacterium]|nr:bifunctional [glutamine synthetase] adenylyltransferase/[glutamine synthetase]-adenylyl-L-tyrosine phosphorylase [Alphaproteobacteria bacterium]
MVFPAFADMRPAAIPHDPARAARTLDSLAEKGFVPDDGVRPLLEAAFGNSPFLARLAIRDAEFLTHLLKEGPELALEAVMAKASAVHMLDNAKAVMTALRRARRNAALGIALADIAGFWSVDQVTRSLSRFADSAVGGALRFLLRDMAETYGHAERDGAILEKGTGIVVLAMGKYGAFELNYSSDIDLVVFYDAEKFPFSKKGDSRGAAVDLVKGLVKLLSEFTVEGYVFRVDLRLRPDAGATQVAISTEAAEGYYEAMGQNWERAAFIKARACAGDPVSGANFLKAMEPFIWRRNLDYAAIEDIHSIKRQIHAHGGHGQIALAGHNIKLGRGGIREIEFFAQTQQLILGGRNPALRSCGTLEAIEALRAADLVSNSTATDLTRAYRFLRHVEHRLQMIEDDQTHVLPRDNEGLTHIANFSGFETREAFADILLGELRTVQGHYARLFEREAPLAAQEGGSLVFTGVEDDPETLETLTNLGFRDSRHIAGAVRGWHHGRIRATRSARAREILTKLMPALLGALANTADPDVAFTQFDRFVSRLPAGVQLFSMFLNNPQLLRLIAEICGSAPRLAQHLAASPSTLDALMDEHFLSELPSRAQLGAAFRNQLPVTLDYEGALDAARRFTREQIFRVGVQIMEGAVTVNAAGPAFANVAECVIEELLPQTEKELSRSAGRVPGGAFCVIAMGKLGGREMSAASDLDLIFVYDVPEGIEETDGPKPLSPVVYYARLAQRFISALTAHTAEGGLYEVDMRLRPSGNKGPVAVSLESFRNYHRREAWTWERLALTRARVVGGDVRLGREVAAAIRATLTTPMDRGKLFADAREMRTKLAAQFPAGNRWDLKFAPGGLVDIEFVAQTLQLAAAPMFPDVLSPNTVQSLRALSVAGALTVADAESLVGAAELQHALMHVLRIALDGILEPQSASPGLKNLLVRAAAATDFASLEKSLSEMQDSAREIFVRVMAASS